MTKGLTYNQKRTNAKNEVFYAALAFTFSVDTAQPGKVQADTLEQVFKMADQYKKYMAADEDEKDTFAIYLAMFEDMG